MASCLYSLLSDQPTIYPICLWSVDSNIQVCQREFEMKETIGLSDRVFQVFNLQKFNFFPVLKLNWCRRNRKRKRPFCVLLPETEKLSRLVKPETETTFLFVTRNEKKIVLRNRKRKNFICGNRKRKNNFVLWNRKWKHFFIVYWFREVE